MKPITTYLQTKYHFFLGIIDLDRKDYFTSLIPCKGDKRYQYLIELVYQNEDIDEDTNIFLHHFEFQKYIDFREEIKALLFHQMTEWNYYCQYQKKMLKRFEARKKILKLKAYHDILSKYFCYDINSIIISFIEV